MCVVVSLSVILALTVGAAALPGIGLVSGPEHKGAISSRSVTLFFFFFNCPFLLNSVIDTNAPAPSSTP